MIPDTENIYKPHFLGLACVDKTLGECSGGCNAGSSHHQGGGEGE